MKHLKVAVASFFTASLLSAAQAKAALFNYEFVNVNGPVPGTVKGSITLPDGDGTFATSLVTIDSYPAALGLGPAPISVNPLSLYYFNSFNVSGGQIISSDFLGLANASTGFGLSSDSLCLGSYLDSVNITNCGVSGVLDGANSTLSFSPAAASTPGPLPLLGAAAAFAHSRRLRARLRDGSRPQA